jgi:hypothetical protein
MSKKIRVKITDGNAQSNRISKAGNALSMILYVKEAINVQTIKPISHTISPVPNSFLKTMLNRVNRLKNRNMETTQSINRTNQPGLHDVSFLIFCLIFVLYNDAFARRKPNQTVAECMFNS